MAIMKKTLRKVLQRFRENNPDTRGSTDDQVMETMFLLAAAQKRSGIALDHRGADGRPVFSIDLCPDSSDII
jgi:hypothetical protein